MRKIVVIALVGAAGFVLYKTVFASSAAHRAYEQFADALTYDRWDAAMKLAGSDEVRQMIRKLKRRPGIIGYETYRGIRGVVHGAPFRSVESETYHDSGKKITLKVVQNERRGSITMAPVGPPTVRRHQDVSLEQTEDGWRVTGFHEKVESLSDR